MENWTFASIPYQRPDVEQAKRSYQAWTEQVKNAKDYAEVRGILLEIDRATMPFDEQCTVAFIRNTLNTADDFYEKELEYLNDALPELEQYSVACYEALFDSPFRKELEQEFGRQLFAQIELQKKSFCEKNIPLAQRENKLVMEYQKLMASCSIEFDGETCNLYGIQKHFEDDDRETRRRAWQAYSDFYEANEPRMEEIWDELIAVRNEMGRNLGYENFIPLAYMQQGRTDYGQEEVASFREQVRKELVPLCSKLYDYQAKRLGLEHVMVWDEERIFPDGNAHAIGGDDWSTVKAVQDGRVHKLPLGSYRTYTPGTDTPMTLLWMAKAMYPDLFADIDLEQQVKDYYQEIYGVELSDEDVAAMFTPSSAAAEGFRK